MSTNKKNIATKIFVISIIFITVMCLSIMNIHYDSLARYPYKDERSRSLIKEYLNKEEIDYIIEYSIAPNMFISFIEADDFNIYHAAEYKELSEVMWMETPNNIVEMIEKTRDKITVEELAKLLNNYSFSDIDAYLSGSDKYSQDSILVENASDLDVWLDNDNTISTRIPTNLQILNEDVASKTEIIVSERIQEPLSNLCAALNYNFPSDNGCGALYVKKGYVSYEEQEELYLENNSDSYYVSRPGHDEHQLGLAVDFAVEGILDENFDLTLQGQWLKENAWQFGFVQTYTLEDEELTGHIAESYHYRFIGTENARVLHDMQKSFAQYKNKE